MSRWAAWWLGWGAVLLGCGGVAPSAPVESPRRPAVAPVGSAAAPQAEPAKVIAADEPGDQTIAAPPGEPEDPRELRQRELAALDDLARHRPAALSEAARPARLPLGRYSCSVSTGYKLRDCVVERDAEGRTLLEIGSGNLVAAKGVVWDDGKLIRFEGWLTDRRPFGCSACDDRCYIEPGSCGCMPAPIETLRQCMVQPVSIELSGAGAKFSGTLRYNHYESVYEGEGPARRVVGAKPVPASFPLRLTLRK